jgi:DNA-binding Lrp family transcriptional regulator
MAISFWKSILTGQKDKSRDDREPTDGDDDKAKSFNLDQEEEAAFEKVDRGTRYVPLDRTVGSVGRYHDLDRQFRLKPHAQTDRQETIKRAMREGKRMPPVKLFKIRDQYYALDGNHRIAAAKEFGWDEILADVVEFLPGKDSPENILYLEKLDFLEQTGLQKEIQLTEFGQYRHLLDQIEEHRRYLEKQKGQPEDIKTAARDWHQTIYLPLCAIIEKGGLLDHFSERTLADLYTYISMHHWREDRQTGVHKYGIGINRLVPNDMEAFREKMAKMKESDYPEMLREITAFILMNVSASKEYKILDKLYGLDEVKEIHSVHGTVDFIVKAVLQRDLVTSDAETIGAFVHNKVRSISGIKSTQTLIPSYSKCKE